MDEIKNIDFEKLTYVDLVKRACVWVFDYFSLERVFLLDLETYSLVYFPLN
jgi:hypothetical protein